MHTLNTPPHHLQSYHQASHAHAHFSEGEPMLIFSYENGLQKQNVINFGLKEFMGAVHFVIYMHVVTISIRTFSRGYTLNACFNNFLWFGSVLETLHIVPYNKCVCMSRI